MNLRSLIVPGLASLAAPAFAAPFDSGGKYDDHTPDRSFLADQMTDFMNDNNLEVRVRAVEFDRTFQKAFLEAGEPKEKKHKEGADALGIQVNFQSCWYADAVGFDASLYTVGDLHSPNPKTRDLLIQTGDGNRTGYSKLGQAYVKAKVQMDQDDDPLLTFKGGRERIYTGLIAGSGSRAAPSSWRGVDFKGGFQGLTYGIAWVDQISLRNSSNFEDLKSFKKKDVKDDAPAESKGDAERIKSVWGAEVGYSIMGLNLSYKDSHAKDFLYTYNLDASYKFNLAPGFDLTLNGKYYKEKGDGKLWIGTLWEGSPGFDKSANIKHFNVTADIGDLMLMAGYSKTSAKFTNPNNFPEELTKSELGVYHYDFGWNTHGRL